ncbi:MAG: hypothetical protein CBC38_06730 [Gammaproteobacteria bacterium TMED78]|nr:MAG: hypothetical protein CBC38_06730 [Gammaproteobacteria bacterium TMED78]|tara:strand:+ start:447 stop:938 length:492 start_codon:yes stop_codon:yes gene_type:complete
MTEKITRTIHIISAFWVIVLAIVIFIDVMGRYLFSLPLLGATEIIKNSVVAVTFLQLPFAIYKDGMIRTTIVLGSVNDYWKRLLRSFANICGLLFFIGTALSAWGPAIEALGVSEYEGEGALRVPTYPIRFLVVVTSLFSSFVYLNILYQDWTGKLKLNPHES